MHQLFRWVLIGSLVSLLGACGTELEDSIGPGLLIWMGCHLDLGFDGTIALDATPDAMSAADVDPPEPACGDERLDPGEECDEDAADCIDCRVTPLDIVESGSYAGSFQAGSFDLFSIQVTEPLDLRLELTGEDDECIDSLQFTVTSTALADPLVGDAADDASCIAQDIEAVAAVYVVRVESAGGQGDLDDYVLRVEFNPLCTPGIDDCPDPCSTNNGECAADADCRIEGHDVICTCREGYTGDGLECADIDECADGLANAMRTRIVRMRQAHLAVCRPGYVGDGRRCDHDSAKPMNGLGNDVPCAAGETNVAVIRLRGGHRMRCDPL